MILQRLNEHYRLVVNKSTPIEITKTLDDYKEPTGVLGSSTLWRQFYSITYNAKAETATEFICRFEELTNRIKRKKEALEPSVEKRQFLLATEDTCPNIIIRENTPFETGKPKGLSLAMLKVLLVEEEARLKEVGERAKEATAMAANVESPAKGKGDIAAWPVVLNYVMAVWK